MIDYYKYYRLLYRVVGYFKKVLFLNRYHAGRGFRLYGGGGIVGTKQTIRLGHHVELSGWLMSDGGTIHVGDHTVIHQGTFIRAKKSVKIGRYVDIGRGCTIQDHNSMSLNYLERREKNGNIVSKPITIGDDVWIGREAIILKGVTIGDRAIVGIRAVVTHDVPADCVVVGNPADIVRRSLHAKFS